jgi:hypothetical protein
VLSPVQSLTPGGRLLGLEATVVRRTSRAAVAYRLLPAEHPSTATRQDADRELAEILIDEPVWEGRFEIVTVDFTGAEPTVGPAGSGAPLPLNV